MDDLFSGLPQKGKDDATSKAESRQPADQEARDRIENSLDETLVVEAAAGTGKTTMLIKRIVALLSSGRSEVDRIVAVTFTEKAAGELKLRVREELEAARQRPETTAEVRANLQRALSRLEEAWVGTIHGFCADILRERSAQANVDPDFLTLTEDAAFKMFSEAFDLWLQQKLEAPPEGVRRSLRRPSSNDPEGPVGRLKRAAWTLTSWRDYPRPWRRDETFRRETAIDAVVETLHDFAKRTELCEKKERDNFYKDTEKYRRLSAEITKVERVRARDYDGIEGQLSEILKRGWRSPRKGYGKDYGGGVSREEIHAQLNQLVEEVEAFSEEADADLAALLQAELTEVTERYEARKVAAGALDFVDLLIRARDLVRNDRDVRAEFQERFTHLFVDEFQDTDPIQAEILLLLASDDPENYTWHFARPVPGKLFIVGDPKQSIYRFRRADLEIYFKVREILENHGAARVLLTTNFRSVENVQAVVNAAFQPWMVSDDDSGQPAYVPLTPWRKHDVEQPTAIALPVPRPYGWSGVTKTAIDKSQPGAVAEFVKWLVEESGWTVPDESDGRRPIRPSDVCLLFRRFDNFYQGDMTRGYVRALEAKGIPHLLVGGRSFHEREEVEAVRTALSAIEWPDDELAVFATLRGTFFAIGDEELWEYKETVRPLHPFRLPTPVEFEGEADSEDPAGGLRFEGVPDRLAAVPRALWLLRRLHRARNERPIADTIGSLLEQTRAHAGFALRPSGDQVLANVLHVAEQARSYEAGGGISFRGFVENLIADADRRNAPEAPILEEGSDGVRIMTVHKAKGLEFPIVVLCDLSANLTTATASRYLDSDKRLCASKLAGWSPHELIENEERERARDAAEGVRLAYVAATRARDLLVIPAIGDERWGEPAGGDLLARNTSWLFPVTAALYPEPSNWGRREPAPCTPEFGDATVLNRPESRGFDFETVRPGLHDLDGYNVVWWDANRLDDRSTPDFGVRRGDLMDKDADPEIVGSDRARFEDWKDRRRILTAQLSRPTLRLTTVTQKAERQLQSGQKPEHGVKVYRRDVPPGRPGGARFGALVHAMLATVPLDSDRESLQAAAELQARLLGATEEETAAASGAAEEVLSHELIQRALAADREGRCRREVPVTMREADGTILDGVVDLAFLEGDTWTIVDFKTDRELDIGLELYRRQVSLYAGMVAKSTKMKATAALLQV